MYLQCLRAVAVGVILMCVWCRPVSAARLVSANAQVANRILPFNSRVEAVTSPALGVSITAPGRVQPGAEWEVACTVTNQGSETLSAIGVQIRRIPGLEVVSVDVGTLDAACCTNYVVSGVAAELAPGGQVTVTLRLRATGPGVWPVGVQVFNDTNDPAEPGDEKFVYAEPPGGAATAPNFAVPFPHVEWSATRFEWIAWTGRSVVFLAPFTLEPRTVVKFPDVETGFHATDDGLYAWAVLRGGDVARLRFSTGVVDLRSPVPLAIAAGRGSILPVTEKSNQVVAFGPDALGNPRVIVYVDGTALPLEYTGGLVAADAPHRLTMAFDRVYVAVGAQLRELGLGAQGLSETRNLDAFGQPGDSLSYASGVLFHASDAALEVSTLKVLPTGRLFPKFSGGIGYGAEPGGAGNSQIRAYDAQRQAVLWRQLVGTEEITELVSGGFFGVLLRGSHGGWLQTPGNPGVDVTLSATLPSPTAELDETVTVPVSIAKSGAWSGLNGRLTADLSDGVIAIDPQSSSNRWVLPVGAIDQGVNLSLSFKITQPGLQTVTLRAESDFSDPNPENNSVTLVWNNPTPTALIILNETTGVEGQPLTLHLTSPAPEAFDVTFHLELLSASRSDVVDTNFTVHFPLGATSATVPISVPDLIVEGPEQFRIVVDSSPATPTRQSGLVTILNDDRVEVGSVEVATTEENSGTHTVSVQLILAEAAEIPVTMGYTTTARTATAGIDFQAVTGEVTFAPGQRTNLVEVTVIGDLIVEADETFELIIFPTASSFPSGTRPTVIIQNDDRVRLPVANIQITEGDSGTNTLVIPVVLDSDASIPVEVSYTLTAGTALAGVDFVAANASVIFAPGQRSNSISVEILGDREVELDETFTLVLSAPAQVVLPESDPVITIVNDDTAVDLALAASVPNPTVETNEIVIVPVTITKTGAASGVNVRLIAELSDGVAAISPESSSNQWVLPVGTVDQEVILSVSFRITQPGAQTVNLRLESDSIDPDLENNSVRLIWNNSFGTELILVDSTVADDGQPLTLQLTSPAAADFDVTLHVELLSATMADVTGLNFTVHFPFGASTATVPILVSDQIVESAEQFRIVIDSSPAPSTQPSAVVTIANDDRVQLTAANVAGEEGNGGSHLVLIPVILAEAAEIPISVNYTTTAGTATAGVDFVASAGELIFAAGQRTNIVEIQVNGDTIVETDENFTLDLSAGVDVIVPASAPTITIVNDDSAVVALTLRVRPVASGPPEFEFNSVVGGSYTVQTRRSLETGVWLNVGGLRRGTGLPLVITTDPGEPEAYFRVLAH